MSRVSDSVTSPVASPVEATAAPSESAALPASGAVACAVPATPPSAEAQGQVSAARDGAHLTAAGARVVVAGAPGVSADVENALSRQRALTALVVHDLRSPMTALSGYLQLLADDLDAGAISAARTKLDECEAVLQKALAMVATLLDVDAIEDGMLHARRVPVRLAQLLAPLLKAQQATLAARGLRFESHVAADAQLLIDPDLFARVFENLLDNGVRYAPAGGRICLNMCVTEACVELTVGNTGPAVPLAEREAIFGRYYQLQARRAGARANRGLGLYFCKLAVEAHQGTIGVQSRGEYGAEFVVRLPVTAVVR